MSRDQQRLADYLSHILEAIERIEHYTEDISEVDFLGNSLVQDAVVRNLEVIGEASHKIEQHYPMFAERNPELPLSSAYQMRNAITHGYFKVDWEIVWKTIQTNLPDLYHQVKAAQATLPKA
ncbi:MAG: DUF86 domain-containing protein [Pseudomonadota bacterium]